MQIKTYIREYVHKHKQAICPISQCNHIYFVTWLLNDLKLDFMHASVSGIFSFWQEKLRTELTPILQLSL